MIKKKETMGKIESDRIQAEAARAVRGQRVRNRYLTSFALTSLLLGWLLLILPRELRLFKFHETISTIGEVDWMVDWDAIPPSEDLVWVPCFRAFGERLCARLTVAMDPTRPLNRSVAHPKVHIAVVLVPGQGHNLEDGGWSESPLLTNIGGPGGEGSTTIAMLGQAVQRVVGMRHDIIGFDPRGIGGSWPPANCFLQPQPHAPVDGAELSAAHFRRLSFEANERAFGTPNSVDARLDRFMQRSRGMSKLCHGFDMDDSIFRYMGVPQVAQDMQSIIQAWDRWTTKEQAGKPKGAETHIQTLSTTLSPLNDTLSTRGKLVYWGWSYGTVLGATYATMFPESVGRMVLDGVVDTAMLLDNTGSDSIRDADETLETFFQYCLRAGRLCALYQPGDEVKDIKARLEAVVQRLREEPVVSVGQGPARMPLTISYSDLELLLFSAAYTPIQLFPLIAHAVALMYEGLDAALLFNPADLLHACTMVDRKAVTYPGDANIGCRCGDERFEYNRTKEYMHRLYGKIENDTKWFPDIWTDVMAWCLYWEIKHVDPPALDWSKFPIDGRTVETSFPILFVSNTLDPVTPLAQGLVQSRRFINSGFLEQLSEGHTSVAQVSLCTFRKIAAYLNEGITVPPPEFLEKDRLDGKWMKCKSDEHPWEPFNPQVELNRMDVTGLSEADIEAMEALQLLQIQLPLQAYGLNNRLRDNGIFASYASGRIQLRDPVGPWP